MGRLRKEDILENLTLLKKVNQELYQNAGSPEIEELLVQCQESAILIGNHLETAYDDSEEKTVKYLVHMLEAYCEYIYQISIENAAGQFPGKVIKRITKKIAGQLAQVYNGIAYDLPPDKKEVVFLPYKASMWDSMESVWKSADEDKNADAYVIPIPYFDKNPDGSFREMHYEGDQYPDYVPITNYEDYILEEREPDIIFIHNPYDDQNYVTSVPPCYYSDHLKKYTKQLVYIPYFILDEINPDDRAKVKGYEHFFTVPGVFHADKVIVQSEDMKQVYVDVLTEYTGQNKRQYWEKKILGLGSPKVDKVLFTCKEDLEIPREWMDIILKPDGNWKKIIFYNTSISALLEHNEKMLKKLESVFEIFRENREDVALLWRPHPLMESTLTSMRPQLWKAYREIRDQYLEEGWGIYDDTADLDRAVVLSDAYYGNMSSVVQLYQKTGKPVMLQNCNII